MYAKIREILHPLEAPIAEVAVEHRWRKLRGGRIERSASTHYEQVVQTVIVKVEEAGAPGQKRDGRIAQPKTYSFGPTPCVP